mgnify:CR=1 FL=1
MKAVNVEELVSRLPLGAGHELQEHAVAAALRAMLVEGRRGVVLADEVGFGKTYEQNLDALRRVRGAGGYGSRARR